MYITQALVKGIICEKKQIVVHFEIEEGTFRRCFPKTKDWQCLLKKKNQSIQVKVFQYPNYGAPIVPTFFDFHSRCKKCGRFYKYYCKHCYQRFKQLNMILARFNEESLKGINKYVKRINKDFKTNTKHSSNISAFK